MDREIEVQGDGLGVTEESPDEVPCAFIGVRACELRAIVILRPGAEDATHVDPLYAERRSGAFPVSVNSDAAGGGACFCVSMNAGPEAAGGGPCHHRPDVGRQLTNSSDNRHASRSYLKAQPV